MEEVLILLRGLYSIMIKISVNFVLLLLFCFCNVATRFVQFSIIWRICIKQSGGSFSFIASWQCSDKIRKYQGHIETFGRRKKIKILMRFPEIKKKTCSIIERTTEFWCLGTRDMVPLYFC